MYLKRPATGLAFCLFYLSSYFTNKYVLSVLKFTYPTLFQGWQTLVGGFLLHISWKIGWTEISSSSRSEVLSWLPASALFVGIIYAGSRALSRLPIPIFLTLHNAADVIACGIEAFVQKEQTSRLKICRVLTLLVAAGCLPFCDPQFDTDGYFWALIHLLCIGDLFSALEFPFLYFYRFHSSCFASGLLGFLLTLYTMKLKSNTSSGQYAAWSFLAKVITAALSPFFFEIAMNVPTACCLLLGGFAEASLLYIERTGI
ncbi:UDP-N-acetylglucosamine transporter TMEM241 isoform X4 [Podarcis muralis]|uniref:transmembrane protein 241 isoform X6 n=1 Tax=Podarcis muralis TaxID=64176 RepID=UPI00109F57F5|nr:transmembrane protein 241 isoform X6 [Podarcis muralis]